MLRLKILFVMTIGFFSLVPVSANAEYVDGMSQYRGYFAPSKVDFDGTNCLPPEDSCIVTIISNYTIDSDLRDWQELGAAISGQIFDGIRSTEQLIEQLESVDCQCITTLHLSGHGSAGTGIAFRFGQFNGAISDSDAAKVTALLCTDATVYVHACDMSPKRDIIALANKLDRKVCAASGSCTAPFVSSDGFWCAEPGATEVVDYVPSEGEKKDE